MTEHPLYQAPYFVGIDPGAKGAIALMKVSKRGKPRIVDVVDMPMSADGYVMAYPILAILPPIGNFTATIEKVHAMPKQGVTSMFNFGKCYGGLLTFMDYAAQALVHPSPREWKEHFGIGSDKERAIAFANRQFGKHEMWNRRGKRGGSMIDQNSGCAEAALLAYYGYQKVTNG